MRGVTCPRCHGYTTPPTVWHAVIPPPMCRCAPQFIGFIWPIANGAAPTTLMVPFTANSGGQ